MRKTATVEQKERAAERRGRVRELARRISAMSLDDRLAMAMSSKSALAAAEIPAESMNDKPRIKIDGEPFKHASAETLTRLGSEAEWDDWRERNRQANEWDALLEADHRQQMLIDAEHEHD